MRTACGSGLAAAFMIVSVLGIGASSAPEAAAQQVARVAAKGAWSPGTDYVRDDLVTSRGSTWRAKRASTNQTPGATSPPTAIYWELFAAGFNPTGEWQGSTTYHVNDLVMRQGAAWRAKRTNTSKVPMAGLNWEPFAAKGAAGVNGADGADGDTGPQGPAGPNTGVQAGTASLPAISFSDDDDTGIFSPSPGKIALTANGSLFLHNIGSNNTGLGAGALLDNTSGSGNAALGTNALRANTLGQSNTAVGRLALSTSTVGTGNTALGTFALLTSTGDLNTAVGGGALQSNTTGSSNIALGANAGNGPTAPSNSIFIGNIGLEPDTDTIKIGTQGTQTSAFIAGIVGVSVSGGASVEIDANGQLGVISPSSRRYKTDIQPMADVGTMLQKLRPVSFRYKKPLPDSTTPVQYGLIAEEVADVLPALALFDREGRPDGVKYQLLPSLLLAGYQQQQKVIEVQAEKIATLQQRLAALEARMGRLAAR